MYHQNFTWRYRNIVQSVHPYSGAISGADCMLVALKTFLGSRFFPHQIDVLYEDVWVTKLAGHTGVLQNTPWPIPSHVHHSIVPDELKNLINTLFHHFSTKNPDFLDVSSCFYQPFTNHPAFCLRAFRGNGALESDRIKAVETGGCPHAAIRASFVGMASGRIMGHHIHQFNGHWRYLPYIRPM